MKKVFLLFGISAFSAASAQQNDVFDVNKHVQDFLKKKNGIQKNNTPSLFDNFYTNGNTESPAKLSYTLSNGDKVYILPVDNMPCVVPGYSQNNMPNISDPNIYYNSPLFKNNTPGTIPNAVKPYRLISIK
jgi:molybdopterin converting factor small subunit